MISESITENIGVHLPISLKPSWTAAVCVFVPLAWFGINQFSYDLTPLRKTFWRQTPKYWIPSRVPGSHKGLVEYIQENTESFERNGVPLLSRPIPELMCNFFLPDGNPISLHSPELVLGFHKYIQMLEARGRETSALLPPTLDLGKNAIPHSAVL